MTDEESSQQDRPDSESTREELAYDPSLFGSVTTHFYRGEIDRTTTWRSRLDQTTNWAVVVVAAILTWAFSSADNPHYVILIGMIAVGAFLVMETNRYREYDIWRDRVRTIQVRLFAEVYDPSGSHDGTWREQLADDLRNPGFTIPLHRALAHRLRRAYLGLLTILLAAWVMRITLFQADEHWTETARILFVPGEVVVTFVAAIYLGLAIVAFVSAHGTSVREFEA